MGVLGEKNLLDVGPVERCRVYYKGEGGGFPQVRAVVSLVCSCCPWFVVAPKVLQLHTNHLVWVLCRPMWVSEVCQLFLVPSRSSNMPLYPLNWCELRNVPQFLLLSMFSTWIHIWVFQWVGSASLNVVNPRHWHWHNIAARCCTNQCHCRFNWRRSNSLRCCWCRIHINQVASDSTLPLLRQKVVGESNEKLLHLLIRLHHGA